MRTKAVAHLLLCIVLAAHMVSLSACGASVSRAKGRIVGYAGYSGEAEHGGITVSAERTDEAPGVGAEVTAQPLPAGTYRVTASSERSAEKVVSSQVTVHARHTVDARGLLLIAAAVNPDPRMKALRRQEIGAGSTSEFRSVAVDAGGNVYAAGYIQGSEEFDFETWSFGGGGEGRNPSDLYDVELVKFDSSGVPQWKQTVSGGSTSPQFESVAVDSRGNVYAAGLSQGSGIYSFGQDVEVPGSFTGYIALLAKYNASGKAQWARLVDAGRSRYVFSSIAVDSDANVYAAGAISGGRTFAFGKGVEATASPSEYNAVLLRYDSSGTAQWARTVSAGGSSQFSGVAVDAGGNVYAAGYIAGTSRYDFGGGVDVAATSAGYNAVLLKYDSSGTAQWARTVSAGVSDSRFAAVAVDSTGNVYAAGVISGKTTNDFGGSSASGSSDGNNVLLVKYDSAGKAEWAKSLSAGSPHSQFSSVAVDSAGAVYAAGVIGGTETYRFGGSVEVTGTLPELTGVIVKYDSSGTAQRADVLGGGTTHSEFRALAVDADRAVYAAGHIAYTYDKAIGSDEGQEATETVSGESAVLVKYGSE